MNETARKSARKISIEETKTGQYELQKSVVVREALDAHAN